MWEELRVLDFIVRLGTSDMIVSPFLGLPVGPGVKMFLRIQCVEGFAFNRRAHALLSSAECDSLKTGFGHEKSETRYIFWEVGVDTPGAVELYPEAQEVLLSRGISGSRLQAPVCWLSGDVFSWLGSSCMARVPTARRELFHYVDV